MTPAPRVVAFDVIGTTFSLEPLRDALTKTGFPPHALEIWFARTLRDAFALASAGSFSPFKTLFETNLVELARSQSISITPEQQKEVLGAFSQLPAYADAQHAFRHLQSAGIRIVALSNGAKESTNKLLERAGLTEMVERTISVEEVALFKPRREVYEHAAQTMKVRVSEMALVATHAWDVHGAKCAGLSAGFVARGQLFPSTMQAPDVTGEALFDVVQALTN